MKTLEQANFTERQAELVNNQVATFNAMKQFAQELKELYDAGVSLKEISQRTYQRREAGENIPYMGVLNTSGKEYITLAAQPIAKQRELKAFFIQKAPDSVLPKYTLFIDINDGVQFKERLGKGKDNFVFVL